MRGMTGLTRFNICVVCVPDPSPSRGTHFVRKARIERTSIAQALPQTPLPARPRVPDLLTKTAAGMENQRSRAPSEIVWAQFCSWHDGRYG